MVSRKYKSRKRKKFNRPRTFLANVALVIGVIIALLGIVLAFIICVDRVAEFLHSGGYQNNWKPMRGDLLTIFQRIPHNLYICFFGYMEASFATLLFFPLVILIVPLTDIFFYWDFTLLIYGYIPIVIGVAIALTAIIAGEDLTPVSKR